MRVALVSLNQQWQEKEANFKRCAEFSSLAAENGCELVIFPEMTLTGYALNMAGNAELEQESASLAHFGDLAHEVALDIVFGACLINKVTNKPQNAFCLARRDGAVSVVYRKIHPFSFAGEDSVLTAGDTLGYARCGDLRLGASVCYDLRFPELFAAMSPHSNVMINIANWPARRIAHWRALLPARAIENQCFMIGVNRVGTDGNGLLYEKSSSICSPDGALMVPVVVMEEMDIYDIDLAEVKNYRAAFPTLRDKRTSLYRDWLA